MTAVTRRPWTRPTKLRRFLSWLANTQHVAASTHKQALSALLFFYGKVLGVDLPRRKEIGRPRTETAPSGCLSPDEVARLLCFLNGEHRLFAQLLYGTGMRINEGLQLRVKRRGLCSPYDHRARRKGRKRPGGHTATAPCFRFAGTTCACTPDLGRRPRGRTWWRGHARCARAQVSAGGFVVELVLGVPSGYPFNSTRARVWWFAGIVCTIKPSSEPSSGHCFVPVPSAFINSPAPSCEGAQVCACRLLACVGGQFGGDRRSLALGRMPVMRVVGRGEATGGRPLRR
jgi:hypothetical protein